MSKFFVENNVHVSGDTWDGNVKCDIFVFVVLQSVVAGLQKACFPIKGKQNEGKIF